MKFLLVLSFLAGLIVAHVSSKALVPAQDDPLTPLTQTGSKFLSPSEEAVDLLRRITRQAATGPKDNNLSSNKNNAKGGCKYRKGSWSACDPTTKVRTRTFILKKGDTSVCESTKVLQKKCKENRKGGKGKNSTKRERSGGKGAGNRSRNNN